MNNLKIQNIKIADIRAYKNNPKLHNRAQVAKIRESIREFGFINPVLLDENLEIIAGHGRVAAAQDAGMTEVPAIILSHLTGAQKRAYRIADNKLTELGKWSIELLNLEFSELSNLDLDFNLEITGFETAEIDLILDGDGACDPKADAVPALTDEDRRCHRGDIWRLGRHTIVCGDALMAITDRMLDLLIPFRGHGLYRPCQHGSASIKQTLPAFVPDMSYANMGIHNGTEASEQFMDFMTGRQSAEQTATMMQNLHYYCGQDTMAMVKLLDVVQGKCRSDGICSAI